MITAWNKVGAMWKKSACFALLLLLGLGLFADVMPQIQAQTSTDKQVKQAVLLIRKSYQTGSSYTFPTAVAQQMNISCSTFEADLQDLNTADLKEGEIGRFSLIAVTASAMKSYLDTDERTLLDDYEEEFGVAEALLGPVPSGLIARYGVSSVGSARAFSTLKWANNDLTNSMNTNMTITTLTTNTRVYAHGGNETQTNPAIWSYTSGNKIRIASSIQDVSPWVGSNFAYWATFWLASKLSSANQILKFYMSVDIDDVMGRYSDSGLYGAPPVSNLYLDGTDIDYMITHFITPPGFNPTLAIEYYDTGNESMVTTFPALYSALIANRDEFDFTSHSHQLDYDFEDQPTTYDRALSVIRSDRDAIISWSFLPTLYYMVPGKGLYSNVTAPAITDSPVWYVAQLGSQTSDTVPYLSQKNSLFDVWSPKLLRVVRKTWPIDYPVRTTGQVLNDWYLSTQLGGEATWDNFWAHNLPDILYGYPRELGGYRIWGTHISNWVYGREGADAPAARIINNITGINILPIVPTRTWALAENLYFIRNFNFTATYDVTQDTLTYNILKVNPNARDRITLVLDGRVKTVDFDPLILKYDQNSTIVTLNYQTSITLKLGEQETTKPYITNYETSLLTASSLAANKFSFNLSAAPRTTSTTKVYAGDRKEPVTIWINGTPYDKGDHWTYNDSLQLITVNCIMPSTAQKLSTTEIVIDWRAQVLGDVNGDGQIDSSDLLILAMVYGSTPSASNWNLNCDINKDSIVDAADLFILSRNYQKTVKSTLTKGSQENSLNTVLPPIPALPVLALNFGRRESLKKEAGLGKTVPRAKQRLPIAK